MKIWTTWKLCRVVFGSSYFVTMEWKSSCNTAFAFPNQVSVPLLSMVNVYMRYLNFSIYCSVLPPARYIQGYFYQVCCTQLQNDQEHIGELQYMHMFSGSKQRKSLAKLMHQHSTVKHSSICLPLLTSLNLNTCIIRFHDYWDQFIWDNIHFRPIHLRPRSFETCSFETTFTWDIFIWEPLWVKTTFILCHVKVKLFWFAVNHISMI